MNILGPSGNRRLNEAAAITFLGVAVMVSLSLVSYHPLDPSWNVAAAGEPRNLLGRFGAHVSDFLIQAFGLGSFLLPSLLLALAWKWVRSSPIEAAWAKVSGTAALVVSVCAMLAMAGWRIFDTESVPGGVAGMLAAGALVSAFNLTGAVIVASLAVLLSAYLISAFSIYDVPGWLIGPRRLWMLARQRVSRWIDEHRRNGLIAVNAKAKRDTAEDVEVPAFTRRSERSTAAPEIPIRTLDQTAPAYAPPPAYAPEPAYQPQDLDDEPPFDVEPAHAAPPSEPEPAVVEYVPPEPVFRAVVDQAPEPRAPGRARTIEFQLPSTDLLNEPEARSAHDVQELKEIAQRIKAKFEEFNVLGSVTQINPGPVVTTFEFKPEAGIKYSRITTLTEDLCLGLQAESILIERIPGKPTVGIEVPNSRREVISLRQILESDEFRNSSSKLTIALGKDISGRIKVAALETMPHLLIAGSTGSGKSVMLNSLIMSVLYKSTPAEVRMILIDPKRVEMGVYENIPHLLTPVITDPRKATNALRNAVLEMERRLKLLASQGVRNIEQFNRKMRQKMAEPRSLFENEYEDEDLKPLPMILIVIDELADLMMLERAGVEESVTRLAQMARAVGMHLVVATQRPSVDVITGLIKANFPARISFRVATRVDSRTILDVMGAEHLLGKGDMLHLPPGSARLVRVHAAYLSETEISNVTDFWKSQAGAEYDQSYLMTPPGDEEGVSDEDLENFNDPAYQDAVRVVLEQGKASTSTLQRRLRLGYGRAARILDVMYKEGIIGPPDGSRPREVLKPPDWLAEVESR